jgi:hypothetical protein
LVPFLRKQPFGSAKRQFYRAEKPEVGKVLLSVISTSTCPAQVLVCLISLVSSPSRYAVATVSAPIRRTKATGMGFGKTEYFGK